MLQMFEQRAGFLSHPPTQPCLDMSPSRVDAKLGDTTLMPYMVSTIFLHVYSPRESPLVGMNMAILNTNHRKIVDVLAGAVMPMDVENIRLKTGLRNWESTKANLLELVLQGTILGEKTTRGWIFWADSTPSRNTQKRKGA